MFFSKLFNNVSCEFDEFRVDTHICKLHTAPVARFIVVSFHESKPNLYHPTFSWLYFSRVMLPVL